MLDSSHCQDRFTSDEIIKYLFHLHKTNFCIFSSAFIVKSWLYRWALIVVNNSFLRGFLCWIPHTVRISLLPHDPEAPADLCVCVCVRALVSVSLTVSLAASLIPFPPHHPFICNTVCVCWVCVCVCVCCVIGNVPMVWTCRLTLWFRMTDEWNSPWRWNTKKHIFQYGDAGMVHLVK